MTTLDTTLPAEVIAILAEYGKSVVFTEGAVTSEYDPATGRTTQVSPDTYSVLSAPPYAYTAQYVNGNTILEGDVKLLIEATGAGFTPTVGQKVTFDSTVWRAVGVFPIYSGANVVAYEIQVRK